MQYDVAPLVGAWIEILGAQVKEIAGCRSLLSWERGLKLCGLVHFDSGALSLLSWERGLKFLHRHMQAGWKPSLLSWERGLKYHLEYQ